MEVNNTEFIIFLHISEAIETNSRDEQVIITASLGGNVLETEMVRGDRQTIFNDNLIWETDKESIKKMKMENLPIKVECFAVKIINGQEIRTLIGYMFLPIRGVPIITPRKTLRTKPHWYKLFGLNPEYRTKKPQVLLQLTITKKANLDSNTGLLKFQNQQSDHVKPIPFEAVDTANMLTSQNGLFIKLLQDEGLLQVGDIQNDRDVFVVKLMFKTARNLEHIVNPEDQMKQCFRFHYNLLGSPTQCSMLAKGDGLYSIQKQIVIHFRTSLSSLGIYFKNVLYIPLDLYYNETLVGHANFKFENLLETNDLSEFLTLCRNEENTLETEGSFMIETLFDLPPNALKPYVEFMFSIKYLHTLQMGNCEPIRIEEPEIATFVDGTEEKSLMDIDYVTIEKTDAERETFEVLANYKESNRSKSDSVLTTAKGSEIKECFELKPKACKSDTTVAEKTEIQNIPCVKNDAKATKNVHRTFSFKLMIETVKLTRRPEIGIWQVSLHHPKADTPFTISTIQFDEICSNIVEFKNLELQLYFSSTVDHIMNIIESEPCFITISGPRGMHATAEVDNAVVLGSTQEKKSGVLLMQNQNGDKIAMAHISVLLEDLGINFNSQIIKYPKFCSDPKQFLDENLAYKMVEELEEWKENVKKSFLVDLKRKEINRLASLSAEWQKRRRHLEEKLTEKLEECTEMSQALEAAHKTIKAKGIQQLEQERLTTRIKAEFEEDFHNKLLIEKQHFRSIEDELSHKLRLQEFRCRELEISKTAVVRESEKLRHEIKILEAEVNDMQQNWVPREELAVLFLDLQRLREKLDDAQKTKEFYKDQWTKIVREIHLTKSENLQFPDKFSYGVEQILNYEQNQLLSEREELNTVKEALNLEENWSEFL